MILPIFGYGYPLLKKRSVNIDKNYPDLKILIRDMYETMYNASGVGLAAPQIGKGIRLFIIDTSAFDNEEFESNSGFKTKSVKKTFINPEIINESGNLKLFEEGCLSIPNIRESINRKSEIKIIYQDENFNIHQDSFDGIVARVYLHSTLINFTQNTDVPVINALSDLEHPCQALADMYTIYNQFSKFQDLNFVYVGDGNNIAASLSLIAAKLGLNFTYSSPKKYQIPTAIFNKAKDIASISESQMNWIENPENAVKNADVIYTDKGVRMGMENEEKKRLSDFKDYQINKKLISKANKEVLIMHDMPAKEGEEIEFGIIDSDISLDQNIVKFSFLVSGLPRFGKIAKPCKLTFKA